MRVPFSEVTSTESQKFGVNVRVFKIKISFENGGKPDVSRVVPLRRVLTATQKLGVTLPIF